MELTPGLETEPRPLVPYHRERDRTTVDPQVYQEQVGLAEMVLEVEDIAQAVRQVRENAT